VQPDVAELAITTSKDQEKTPRSSMPGVAPLCGGPSYTRDYGVAGVGLGTGRAENGCVKAAELARLGDFFSRLASGDHKSLYNEVTRKPKEVATEITKELRRSPSPVRLTTAKPTASLEPIALTRTVSAESTSTTATSVTTSDSGDSVLSPRSSISSLPSPKECTKACGSCLDIDDSSNSNSSEEDERERPRGRARTRDTANKFKRIASPNTYTVRFPGGTFDSYRSLPDRFVKEEAEASKGGRFTFKLMLHDLYEDVNEFRRMVETVLEDSKAKFQPLDMEPARRRRRSDSERNRTMSDAEAIGEIENVRRGVAERVVKKRRTRFGTTSELGDNIGGHSQDVVHQDQPYVPSEGVFLAMSSENAADYGQRVLVGDPGDSVTCEVLNNQDQCALVFRPRMKRRLST
jgi:hypothetical protein